MIKPTDHSRLPWYLATWLLLILGLWLRFWQLSTIPFSYYHDEMDYVITGEAIARFGTDLSGNWRPTQLQPLQTLNVTAELPAVFHALFQEIFGLGPQNGHLPAATFGVLTAIVLGLGAFLITNSRWAGMLTSIIVLLNPWHTQISRSGYEVAITLGLQTILVLAVMFFIRSKLRIGLALLTLFIMVTSFLGAFYTYHGAKFTLPAILLVCIFLVWCRRKVIGRTQFFLGSIFLILTLVMGIGLTWRATQSPLLNSRSDQVLSLEYFGQQVDTLRKQSLDLPLASQAINKLSVGSIEIFRRLGFVFDPYRLLITGAESGWQFSLAVHGFFYLSTLVFLIAGIVFLYQKHRFWLGAVLIFLIAGTTSSLISIGFQSTFRSGLAYLMILLVAGVGLWAVINHLLKHKHRQVFLSILFLWLIIESIWFGLQYFGRYPLVTIENSYFNQRLQSAYLSRINQPATIIGSGDPYSWARSYIAYGQKMADLSENERAQFASPGLGQFQVDQLVFTNTCPSFTSVPTQLVLLEPGKLQECGYEQLFATASGTLVQQLSDGQTILNLRGLASPLDSGMYIYVLNDPICVDRSLAPFVRPTNINQFKLDQLSDEEFCQTWMQAEQRRL